MIVIDTNIVAYAVLPGEHTEAALAVAQEDPDWIAPVLLRSELRNILATSMRVGRMDLGSAVAAYAEADALVQTVEVEDAVESCLRFAQEGQISGYDAEFVTLASQLKLQLVTADRRLAKAFPKQVVHLDDWRGSHL